MKATKSRALVMTLGGVLIATLAAGCYGGGGGGGYYSNGYNSSYSSYGSSYPYSGYRTGYSYPQRYGNSYYVGPQNPARADVDRDRRQYRESAERPETQHYSVDRARVSARDSEPNRTEKN
jgi:hypothetical protein